MRVYASRSCALSFQIRNRTLQVPARSIDAGVRIAQLCFVIKSDVVLPFISAEHVVVGFGPHTEQHVGISNRRNRNHFTALDHRCKIHKVLTSLDIVLAHLSDLGGQEPVPVLVMPQLWRHLGCSFCVGRVASICFNFLNRLGPQFVVGTVRKIR